MNRIGRLIREYCPNGVEIKKIGDLTFYEQPAKYIVSSTKYDDAYNTPVLTAGQSFILGYTNETNGIYPASPDNPVIIFDDFTAAFKWVDFPFKVKSSAMKMIKANEEFTSLRYLYHLMGKINFSSAEHKRLWIGLYSEFEVPVPPLPVQREIVQVLDNFTLLTAELTAELTARKKQYEYYRDMLLSHGSLERNASYATCNEIFELKTGDQLNKTELTETGLYPVYNGGINPSGYHTDYNTEANTIAISQGGASAGYVNYVKTPFWAGAHCYRVMNISPKVNRRFLYFFLKSKQSTLQNSKKGAGIPGLNRQEIYLLSFPLIPLETQEKIAHVLDNFDAICADLNIGLPAEIEARQKQYEYYRDLLLTFAETDRQTDRQTDSGKRQQA